MIELLVGVEKLDAADGAGLVDVDEEILGEADGLDGALLRAEADVGDVGLRVVGDLHGPLTHSVHRSSRAWWMRATRTNPGRTS